MTKNPLPLFIAAAFAAQSVQAENAITDAISDGYVEAGDYIQIAVPATGLLAAWIHSDAEGAKQLTYSLGTTIAVVQAGKFAVGRTRPNVSNTASFPSGHTAAAFSGAAFLQSRYGAAWGIPGYVAATYVGASRIYGNRHYADDVVAGAGIAFLVNQYFVSPYTPEGVNLSAAPTQDGVMVNVAISNDALSYDTNATRTSQPSFKERNHSFSLDVGFNTYDTMADLGANNTLRSTTPLDPSQPFAAVRYGYKLDDASSFELNFAPNETRRSGLVSNDFSIGGKTYQTGETVFIALRQWSLGANYLRHYQLSEQFNLTGGLGLYGYALVLEGDLDNGGRHGSDKENVLMPSITLQADYALTDQWGIRVRGDYQTIGSDYAYNVESGFNYSFNPEWEMGLKYNTSKNKWDKTNIQYHTESIVISVTNHY
ncbi:phosphatase PAP2 family protein [Vibrio sp.]|uniref:phosphatase PAP2 family protein n=1 Tax=Vibrio sp. TaxID=678 RepID=UPI003D149F87